LEDIIFWSNLQFNDAIYLRWKFPGIYSGSLGFFSVNGTADFSVIIRTLVCTASSTSVGSGGAIISLSDPHAEFAEMLLKAHAPTQVAQRHRQST
jgi:anthranilate/para-aminobenzoate synthase component I